MMQARRNRACCRHDDPIRRGVSAVKTKINRNIMNIKLAIMALLGGTMLATEALAADASPPGGVARITPVFATVGKTVITQQEYDKAYAAAVRAKFYHFKAPAGEVAKLQREVGDKLVADVLLVREAKRRGLKPDEKLVKQGLDKYEQRYRDNEQWKKVRAREMARTKRELQQENLLAQLEKIVRNVPAPTEEQLREYYTAHLDKFTAPEQQRVSLILLKVDPSSPAAVWQKTLEQGKDLVARLHGGADFAALVREYSGDLFTVDQDGDMGYLHSGMLSDAAQEQVNKLKPGEISDPVVMMEGVAIFRLTDRQPPKLNNFEDIKERAQGLWHTEQGKIAWKSLVEQLRKKTPVRVNELRYLPLPSATEKPAEMPAEKPAEKPTDTK
jgi:parvulin-like peptidyl-prolyl isomerase